MYFYFLIQQSNFSFLRKQSLQKLSENSPKALWKFGESKHSIDFNWKLSKSSITFVECSTKAGWLSLSALRKQEDFCLELYESSMIFFNALQKQDDFRCFLCEGKMTFIESSMKAGWLMLRALQKQDEFHWELYESRMTCVETSTKVKKHVNRNNTKFRDKLAYVGGPSFSRQPRPFGERRSRNICHPGSSNRVIRVISIGWWPPTGVCRSEMDCQLICNCNAIFEKLLSCSPGYFAIFEKLDRDPGVGIFLRG